ncbi:hypothetical protein N0V94_007420 [Neodidymelliopsis sp. IMI 364377]|nr:hypothetical protein N0V94_007420 [Neodidymelliopsis sp. IMI 364377]
MTPSPAKRRKLDGEKAAAETDNTTSTSLKRPVSPPNTKRKAPVTASLSAPTASWSFDDVPKQILAPSPSIPPPPSKQTNQSDSRTIEVARELTNEHIKSEEKTIASPFQLTKIRDLAPYQNVDTIELKDILGDPMIKECWNFNFLFDLDFVMQQFDEDVRDLVKVKIMHGFWRRDDERRIDLMETAERYPNIELINAYLPDPFGTHHSKMLILLRHDDCAQVIIHTANMITKDWTNMTQAVWRSALLPRTSATVMPTGSYPIGSGQRFQLDLLHYLNKYEKRLRRLSDELLQYDFSAVQAAFISSAPSRQIVNQADPERQTSFGWLGLQEILNKVPVAAQEISTQPPHVVVQVSSIATLGAAPTWLSNFQSALARSQAPQQSYIVPKPKFNIIFPTPEEVRTSLDGYESGGSIHTKVQSVQQQKQLQYLHPIFCHWKHLPSPSPSDSHQEAHRGPAAPHIKTYIRFSNDTYKSVDWALLTSANLSKQAWGDVVNKQGELRIQSYETGVLIWPELFAEPGSETRIVPVCGKDMPAEADVLETPSPIGAESMALHQDEERNKEEDRVAADDNDDDETEDESEEARLPSAIPSLDKGKAPVHDSTKKRILVGLRMPYDLPLSPYSATDKPWCATQQYTDPDWKGRVWSGW